MTTHCNHKLTDISIVLIDYYKFQTQNPMFKIECLDLAKQTD